VRAGELVNGYRLLADFTVVGAGLSRWTFAERGGRQYFLKEFLAPTYPGPDAPGSERIKARKRERCAVFEAHHRGIQEALAPISHLGGNLIVTLDFFRWGAKYYKVTEKVDVAGLEPPEVAALPMATRLVLLKTVAHSLKILHDRDIVHGDLKPNQVLIKRTEFGYTTKLIDFDSAFLVGRPAPPDEIVGTINYYSPETVGYIQETGVAAADLGTAADIFTLGLVYAELLTGSPPVFDRERYGYASIAARSGEVLRLRDSDVPDAVRDLVERMMLLDPAARPTIGEVHAELLRVRVPAEAAAAPAPRAAPEPPSTAVPPTPEGMPATIAAPSALRGRGLRAVGKVAPESAPTPAPAPEPSPEPDAAADDAEAPPSRLLGKLLGRTRDPGSS